MIKKPDLTILRDVTVYTENGVIEEGYVLVAGKAIQAVGPMDKLDSFQHMDAQILSLPGYHLIPGMIDIHIHGVAGADVMDATPEALETIAAALPQEGTTSFLGTTITNAPDKIERALVNAADYRKHQQDSGMAEMLGVHLEGPFISEKRAGAQPLEHILAPDLSLLKRFYHLSDECIRIVTLAPEKEGAAQMIRWLRDQGVIASVGHSDALYEEVDQAISEGAAHVTHLYNGMRGIHHREPGVVGAALLRNELTAELIADHIHCRPEMLELAFRMKTKERLILITDAIRAKCLRNGTYDLGGQSVTVKGEKATLSDGTLAGSILKMGHALQNMMRSTGCTMEDLVYMTSSNPARQLGVFDRKGSIAPGKDADLVILNPDHEVAMTYCRGQLAYQK
ncbi:N-acetylglucosamine-6-phosphate deacetylase [Melghirimyces algeriensis]|uniref:N-acetylglucosamine-6-phosphate deacetylase n=1 Tax=Melghirimyces algeriensis TaxID=910412 RepID=A0A521BYT2_9BACL|nr:N-acetylglucosamine-6-phosphate deacetylase [Melghirimyces algeriensis]SMO52336.1 N-acetylglucosamine 6-phosphate deacetylase [Melghirimyces algeriensis]